MAGMWQKNYQVYKSYVRNLSLIYQKRKDIRSFVELLLSLSVISIFGIFAIRPTLVTISDLNTQIRGKRDTLTKLDNKINALSSAQEIFDRNRTAIALLDQAIPGSPDPDSYVRQVEGLAKRHSLFVFGMHTEEVPVLGQSTSELPADTTRGEEEVVDYFPSDSPSYKFEIDVTGDYGPISAFLSDFESLRRPMFADISSIHISQGDLPGSIAASIVGRMAYLSTDNGE